MGDNTRLTTADALLDGGTVTAATAAAAPAAVAAAALASAFGLLCNKGDIGRGRAGEPGETSALPEAVLGKL